MNDVYAVIIVAKELFIAVFFVIAGIAVVKSMFSRKKDDDK